MKHRCLLALSLLPIILAPSAMATTVAGANLCSKLTRVIRALQLNKAQLGPNQNGHHSDGQTTNAQIPLEKTFTIINRTQRRSANLQRTIRNIVENTNDRGQIIQQLNEIAKTHQFTDEDFSYLLEKIPQAVDWSGPNAIKAILDDGQRRGLPSWSTRNHPTEHLDIMIIYHALKNTDVIFNQRRYLNSFSKVEEILKASRNWTEEGSQEDYQWALIYVLRKTHTETGQKVIGRRNILGTNNQELRWIRDHLEITQHKLNAYNQFLSDVESISKSDFEMILSDLPKSVKQQGIQRPDNNNEVGIESSAIALGVIPKRIHGEIGLDLSILHHAIQLLNINRGDTSIFNYFPQIANFIKESDYLKAASQITYRNQILETFYQNIARNTGLNLFSYRNRGTGRYLDFLFNYISNDDFLLYQLWAFIDRKRLKLDGSDFIKIVQNIPRGKLSVFILRDNDITTAINQSIEGADWAYSDILPSLDLHILFHALKRIEQIKDQDALANIEDELIDVIRSSRAFSSHYSKYREHVVTLFRNMLHQIDDVALARQHEEARVAELESLIEQFTKENEGEINGLFQRLQGALTDRDHGYKKRTYEKLISELGHQNSIKFLHLFRQGDDGLVDQIATDYIREFLSGNLAKLDEVEAAIPRIQNRVGDFIIDSLLSPQSQIPFEVVAREIRGRFTDFNAALRDRLRSYIESNAPPSFLDTENPWGELLAVLPFRERSWAVKQLMQKALDESPEKLFALIEQFPPIDGVRTPVTSFLSQNASRLNYTDLATDAFLGNRFNQFFPWVEALHLTRNNRADLEFAILTHPHVETSIPLQYFQGSKFMLARGGYYINNMANMNGVLQDDFYRQIEQVRVSILQGHYDRQGYASMAQIAIRGWTQVENSAPAMARYIESNLRGGFLAEQDPIYQRQFAYNWGIRRNNDLVQNIRQRAYDIANSEPSFYNLRVEIHNFPNFDILQRTKEFRSNVAPEEANLDILIEELEIFLGVNGRDHDLKTFIDNLSNSNHAKANLREITADYHQSDPRQRLQILLLARKECKHADEASNSRFKRLEFFDTDRGLSDFAFSETTKIVDSLGEIDDISALIDLNSIVELIIEHIELDDLLSPNQVVEYKQALEQITKSTDLEFHRQKELYTHTLNNLLNQVQYKLERNFGKTDNLISKTLPEREQGPIKFNDSILRSSSISHIGNIADRLQTQLVKSRGIIHEIAGHHHSAPIEVFNPGEAIGILRFNKDPKELIRGEIAVFDQMPAESGIVEGIITLEVGARLSHLQLLARSLGIPNIKVDHSYRNILEQLDGKKVLISANANTNGNGKVVIKEFNGPQTQVDHLPKKSITIPIPDHGIAHPISFQEASKTPNRVIAGPKGMKLSEMHAHDELGEMVPDGLILPFGYFNRYLEETGIKPLVELLGKTKTTDEMFIAVLSARIQKRIEEAPIPDEMLDQAMQACEQLALRIRNRSGEEMQGVFVRSDTNIEDLEGFNGAGLNESVGNVRPHRQAIEMAIKHVWKSPFKEKSIVWRATALHASEVPIAEPSVIILPTIRAKSSGVIISRGGTDWTPGKGPINANYGIGQVVEAEQPVEEITLENGSILRYSFTVSNQIPRARYNGGIAMVPTEPGKKVLSQEEILLLNQTAIRIDQILGEQQFGWDIEYAFDLNGRLWILQARPN